MAVYLLILLIRLILGVRDLLAILKLYAMGAKKQLVTKIQLPKGRNFNEFTEEYIPTEVKEENKDDKSSVTENKDPKAKKKNKKIETMSQIEFSDFGKSRNNLDQQLP